jgi:hypothetical protein
MHHGGRLPKTPLCPGLGSQDDPLSAQGRAQLRKLVAVAHTLAPIGRWQDRRAR